MKKSINPYSFAVTATERAINDRKSKLKEQSELEQMALDDKATSALFFQLGRQETLIDSCYGQDKEKAEKALKKLQSKIKKVKGAFSRKNTNLMLKHENECAELELALKQLTRLSEQWQEARDWSSLSQNV